jgi:hypothetical protein
MESNERTGARTVARLAAAVATHRCTPGSAPEVTVLHGGGVVAVFPEGAGATATPIESLSRAALDSIQGPGGAWAQRFLRRARTSRLAAWSISLQSSSRSSTSPGHPGTRSLPALASAATR